MSDDLNIQLNIQVARVLTGQEPQMRYCVADPESGKWTEVQSFGSQPNEGTLKPCTLRCQFQGESFEGGVLEVWDVVPDYSGDYADARTLEDEVERHGLSVDYVSALIDLVRPESDGRLVWAIIRATPTQRAQAFLRTVQR